MGQVEKKPLSESLKELARLLVFAVISYLLTDGLIARVLDTYFISLDPFARLQISAVITLVLRTVDKYIHESTDIKANGLMPF